MGRLSLSLLPLPTLQAEDLSLQRGSIAHTELHIRQARVRLSWLSLLRFKPIVRTLTLKSPTLDISSHLIQGTLNNQENKHSSELSFTLPRLPHAVIGLRIAVEDGTCRLTGVNGKDSLVLSGINAGARLPGLLPGNLDLSVDSIRYLLASGLDISAAGSSLSLSSLHRDLNNAWSGDIHCSSTIQLEALDAVLGHTISEPYRYFPMTAPLRLSLTAAFTSTPDKGMYSAHGNAGAGAVLTMNGSPVPISLNVPFQSSDFKNGMEISDADVRMGDDHAVISGRLSGLNNGFPVLNGRADIRHFSLTRWFGFGRAMDAGLQHALDDITGTFEEFELTPKGVIVPHLKAVVKGIELSGSGSCKEFLKPEILISAHAKQADLSRIFPELHGEIPDMSHLPAPVLPLGSGTPGPDDLFVGYDIHISADDAAIAGFQAEGVDVHVVPAPRSGTKLAIKVDDAYGGKAVSSVYIRDKIRVTANLDNVSLAGPARALAGYDAITGLLKKGTVDLSFEPGSGSHMLSTLGGSLQASLEKGKITVKGSPALPYRELSINAKATAVPVRPLKNLPPSMDFRGKWNIKLDTEQWSATADIPQGILSFSTSYGLPCSMPAQDTDLQITLNKALFRLWPEDLSFSLKSKLAFNTAKGTVTLAEAVLRAPDFTMTGSTAVSDILKKPSASGKITFSSETFKKAATSLGLPLPESSGRQTFRKAEIGARYSLSSDSLRLDALTGHIDDIRFSGHLQQTIKNRPSLTGTLHSPVLDLDPYLSGLSSSGSRNTPLPLMLLKNTDADLKITVNRLRAFSTTFSHASLPVSQKNGILSIPFKAMFPGGGQAEGRLQAAVSNDNQYADISLDVHNRQVDMLNLSRDRGQKTLISGTGNAEASLRSKQKYWEDWKRTLDGKLSLSVANGAITTPSPTPRPNAPAQPKESRTSFKTLSLSATVSKGIVSCRDFLIKDGLLNVSGEGTINLDTQTIDGHATITVAGIPELPLTIKGNLFAPQTNYKLLGAVTGTVGNIGSTVFDIIGGVLSAPLRLIMGNKI